MRHLALMVGVLTLCPAMGLAQETAPRPFAVSQFSVGYSDEDLGGAGLQVGFDATIGLRAWRGLQLITQSGHVIGGVTPASLRPQPGQPGRPPRSTSWYGAAGARYFLPAVWRLRPFAETSAGLAHISSQVYSLSGVALLPDGEARNTVPLASLAAGVQLHLGRRFTVDGGYRAQRFFSDADATRRNHYMALGVRF